jgi:uncharacterized protein (DUF1800 family)
MLRAGLTATRRHVLAVSTSDPGLANLSAPAITDLGPRPANGTAALKSWEAALASQQQLLVTWWLDRMVLSTYPLVERLTWFWHGHWATSIEKVVYPLPMLTQNQTLRTYALGSFDDMARAIVVDGAMTYWLDNEQNYVSAPNENLARELMELFTLGVNQYTQGDVEAAARALTGYSLVSTSGAVTFDPSRHVSTPITILGSTRVFPDAPSLATFLVAQGPSPMFVVERLWFRLVSSTHPPTPAQIQTLVTSFAARNISALVAALARSSAWSNPALSLARSPVEWLVAACRALGVQPSTLPADLVLGFLNAAGQVPFLPPNVGGWPSDLAWLNSAASELRMKMAEALVKVGDLSAVSSVSGATAPTVLSNWLGVASWSARTASVLSSLATTPPQMVVAALCAPEYVVSA